MTFAAFATDYDGTLATEGRVAQSTIDALERLRASGRKLLLVTGRLLDDLASVFPRLDLFDRVVVENGALLYRPETRDRALLTRAPPASFAATLRARGVPVTTGEVIVATWEPHGRAVFEVIRDLGLELHVVFNKGAVMALPAGVNKASGLAAALADLGLSPHNSVGIGDAENDHAFLAACECGVAVANALPTLCAEADLVTQGDHGAGVEELIERLLRDDLASVEPRFARHAIPYGTRRDGTAVRLSPHWTRLLVVGPSGGGKTTAASGVIERLLAARYQCCLVDPEGDYEGFGGLIGLGTAERPPAVAEVLELLEKPDVSVSVGLLTIHLTDRPLFVSELLSRLQQMRGRTGRPHWIALDEAHHLLPSSWHPASFNVPGDVGGLLLVTVRPDRLSRAILEAVNLAVAVGDAPDESLRSFLVASARTAPQIIPRPHAGEAIAWSESDPDPFPVTLSPPAAAHQRHRRKYATGDLHEKAFHFRGRSGQLHLRAQNLALFLQMADGVDDDTWTFHLESGDYARWFRDALKDDALAAEAERIEAEGGTADDTRRRVREAIERRYAVSD